MAPRRASGRSCCGISPPRPALRRQNEFFHRRGEAVSMDLSAFYQTFFDEADELLADMEQHLLQLDPQVPDGEQLNAIFRAAHSIKGGAGTFGFSALQETTHLLENLLDEARRGEMSLNTDSVDLFLKTKDIMQDQLDAYKMARQPDEESYRYICEALRELARTARGEQSSASEPAAGTTSTDAASGAAETITTENGGAMSAAGDAGTVGARSVETDSGAAGAISADGGCQR